MINVVAVGRLADLTNMLPFLPRHPFMLDFDKLGWSPGRLVVNPAPFMSDTMRMDYLIRRKIRAVVRRPIYVTAGALFPWLILIGAGS